MMALGEVRMTLIEAILLGLVGVLALAVAGTLRELAFLRVEIRRLQRIGGGAPLSLGDALPDRVADLLEGRLTTSAGSAHYVAVLDAGCSGCSTYARRLGELVVATPTLARDVTAVVAGEGSGGLGRLLRSAGVSSIPDPQRRITDDLGVVRTPTTIVVEASSATVTDVWTGRRADELFTDAVASGDS